MTITKAALLLAFAVTLPVPAQSDLSAYRDKNRLLLVFAPSRADSRWQKENMLLAKSASAFRERDLLRLDYLERDGSQNAALRRRYGVKPGQFRVLLVGKDGHVASGGPTPISLSELDSQIDRMPMRREEIRRRGH